MNDSDKKLRSYYSFYSTTNSAKTSTQNACKSDMNLDKARNNSLTLPHTTKSSCEEYYKKYEHDELPVKERTAFSEATGDSGRISLTNSDIDRLENKHLKICQDVDSSNRISLTDSDIDKLEDKHLKTCQDFDSSKISKKSLDSNLKFFKTTVLQIFENFYNSMKDFELYKIKFHEILARNQDSSAEMEDFIKDIFQHMSLETVNNSTDQTATDQTATETNYSGTTKTTSSKTDLNSVVEAYRNETYTTDSTCNDNDNNSSTPTNSYFKNRELINIILLNSTPFIQIKMNSDRNTYSEINITHSLHSDDYTSSASAEDLKKVNAKRLELENMYKDQRDNELPDNDIPVKTSSAKNNIFGEENHGKDLKHKDDRSFVSKLCNYLCKRFRKTPVT